MKALTTANLVALLAALLLTAGEVLIMQYDAQQRVVRYQAEIHAAAERG